MPRPLVGGTRLVGRHYYLGQREVEVLTGWGPGATARNVLIRYLDTGERAVRPFRGLRIARREDQFPARTPHSRPTGAAPSAGMPPITHPVR